MRAVIKHGRNRFVRRLDRERVVSQHRRTPVDQHVWLVPMPELDHTTVRQLRKREAVRHRLSDRHPTHEIHPEQHIHAVNIGTSHKNVKR